MVNHGPSRACLTCKSRRVRCDGGRPKCKKCNKSKRTCLGYKKDESIQFRGYASGFVDNSSTARQLALPPSLSPKSSTSSPYQFNMDPDLEVKYAVEKFFFEYVLVPKDKSLSRGYLSGLGDLLNQAGPDSALVRAIKVVAMANLANKGGSQDLHSKASALYYVVLVTFQKTLNDLVKCNSEQALMTATLLGLYEMIAASEARPNAHSTHINGVSSIMSARNLPFGLLPGASLFQTLNPLLSSNLSRVALTPGLSAPYFLSDADPATKNLDVLMIQLRPIMERAAKMLSDSKTSKVDLRILKQDASLLNKELSLWPLCQPKEWIPQTLGSIEEAAYSSDASLETRPFWPGKVDTYFDLYVVAVWDAYRKSRLKLLQTVADCLKRLQAKNHKNEEPVGLQKIQTEMQGLVDELCASIPFHLMTDLPSCIRANKSGDLENPGKALGGLLLMYPLYIASTLTLISLKQRTWMKGRLSWIGRHMGIRQATMLADNVDDVGVAQKSIAVGHTLLFAGTLLQPDGSQPASDTMV